MHQLSIALAFWLLTAIEADVLEYHWTISWVQAAPDGYRRPVIGINGRWPCPVIKAVKNDRIIVHLTNDLGNQTVGLHWHGIDQVGTSYMDGTDMGSQCPLAPDGSMTYNFTATSAGTFWYHSHNLGQYPDGLRGPFIVSDPDDPYQEEYDDEYHDQSMTLVTEQLLIPQNTIFAPPFPQTLLLNDGMGASYPFSRGSTYRFRIMNFAALGSFMVHFQNHPMTVIMTDASYTRPQVVDMLRIGPGQRYDVLLTAKEEEPINYPFLIAMDINRDYRNHSLPEPVEWLHNATGHLIMNPNDDFTREDVILSDWDPFNESGFEPLLGDPLPKADRVFQLDFRLCKDQNDMPRACFDDNLGDPGPYVPQKVPTLYTALSTGSSNANRSVYGHVHPLIVHHNEVVDIVINLHDDPATHPFHLHGHQFEILTQPPPGSGPWPGSSPSSSLNSSSSGSSSSASRHHQYQPKPPRRDTFQVNGNSHAVIRFRADNPGVFLLHCHVEWHVEMGLVATIIEAPELLRWSQSQHRDHGSSDEHDDNLPLIPEDHIRACKTMGIPYAGNAGGNTVDLADESNYNTVNAYPYIGSMFVPPQHDE